VTVQKVKDRDLKWNNEWKEDKRLVFGKLGMRIVADM
jgi:hypothetical protein